jgi:hypothetical protein
MPDLSQGYSETTAHVYHVAHCAACGETADGDGCEYGSSPEDAVKYVLDYHEWERLPDGRLMCDECRAPEAL